MKNITSTICLALAMAFGIGGNAFAGGHDKTGTYAGLGFGHATLSSDNLEDTFWAPSVFAGYMPHDNFGFEGGMHWFLLELDPANGADVERKVNTFYLAAIGRYYVADNFAIYGKGGFHRWNSEVSIGTTKVSENSIDGIFGAGMQLDLSDSTSARLEYVRYLTDEAEIDGEADIIGFHLLYRF